MRHAKAASKEAQGSSTPQYNQAQEAHLICHVHIDGRADRDCSLPVLSDMDIPEQEPATEEEKKQKRIAVSSAGALLYSQGLPGRSSHVKPTIYCPVGER